MKRDLTKWREQALAFRELARTARDDEIRATLLDLAGRFERLANVVPDAKGPANE
ncbi:MAG TPA: hypothetical protein VKY65_12715 [Alphaproteobacteria bacterium]|nr:hypothetical protein [Alphaproteobacteria bacterium]